MLYVDIGGSLNYDEMGIMFISYIFVLIFLDIFAETVVIFGGDTI